MRSGPGGAERASAIQPTKEEYASRIRHISLQTDIFNLVSDILNDVRLSDKIRVEEKEA